MTALLHTFSSNMLIPLRKSGIFPLKKRRWM